MKIRGNLTPPLATAAFTLIEVALSVAIVAFALVAIIGVMPAGLNVQRENREETIINNDARYFIDAIKGSVVPDILRQRVAGVAVYSNNTANPTFVLVNNPSPSNPNTNPPAGEIVGMLSTPSPPGTTVLNYAWVRGLSGSLGDVSGTDKDLVFTYILITHIEAHNPATSSLAPYQSTNLWDVSMTFRWPARTDGTVGNGRQSYRTMIAGQLNGTNLLYSFKPTYFQSP